MAVSDEFIALLLEVGYNWTKAKATSEMVGRCLDVASQRILVDLLRRWAADSRRKGLELYGFYEGVRPESQATLFPSHPARFSRSI
jgi:hypothetical protein